MTNDEDTRSDRLPRDTGSAGVETAFAVTALLLMLFFIVGAMRYVNTDGDVAAAARAGARAAAVARTEAQGAADATAVVQNMLTNRGVACAGGPAVTASRSADGLATVTVSCTVSLTDVAPAGFAASETVTATAAERVDTARGGS